jgi:RNA polymerase sigma-70 factor (ECF subfamily)
LVEAHRDIAFRVAYLVTGAAADAEDATQDAFVKAFRQIRRFDSNRPFRPWLLRIVGNEARNRRRSEVRRLNYEVAASGRSEAGPPSEHPETAALRADIDRQLLAAVNRLPEKERLVVGLRYFLDLSGKEAAVAVGVPVGTIKSRLNRALQRLREEIGDLDV